ncbi:MAG: riboflavin synthase [Actinomycetia bacterium]|nr:riboflavin synthase [Actinomycetes bacterium]
MFTGIVQELGTVESLTGDADGVHITLRAAAVAPSVGVGDSVALNGCCLTVTGVEGSLLHFDAVPETLSRTPLGQLAPGTPVNVEPALRAGEPLGGHLIQGHVDGTGVVRSVEPDGEGSRIRIDAAPELVRYCVEKGSITVDGVSLTVASVSATSVEIALIPHTLAATTLGRVAVGQRVNLEVDVLAKYVERLLNRSDSG